MSGRAVFDSKVQEVVARIPRGRVATYGDVAAMAGYPGYARHVGRTLQGLPDDSGLPWHRVINSQGGISARPDRRSQLEQARRLRREGVPFRTDDRVDLRRCRYSG